MEELAQALAEKFNLPIAEVYGNFTEIFQRYVTYKIVGNSIGTVIGLIGMILMIKVFLLYIKDYKLALRDKEDSFFFDYVRGYGVETTANGISVAVIASVLFVCSIICFICSLIDLLGWVLVPEIMFLQHFIQ
jgi:hypothetical protein